MTFLSLEPGKRLHFNIPLFFPNNVYIQTSGIFIIYKEKSFFIHFAAHERQVISHFPPTYFRVYH